MFCHDRYSLLFSERKNSTIVSTRAGGGDAATFLRVLQVLEEELSRQLPHD
jgi:hypothetical protein